MSNFVFGYLMFKQQKKKITTIKCQWGEINK